MKVHTSNRWLETSEKPIQKKSQKTRFHFLLPRIVFILLACCITAFTVVQPIYGACPHGNNGANNGNNGANNGNNGANNGNNGNKNKNKNKNQKKALDMGLVKLSGDGLTLQATLNSLTLSGLPASAPLIIHIHAQNTTSSAPADLCKGPVLFAITGESSTAQGTFSLTQGDILNFVLNSALTDAEKQALLKATDLSKWVLNVHDAAIPGTDIDPKTGKPKPISVACGPLNAQGVAILIVKPIPPNTPAPTATATN